jgi:hypothetical protein
MGRLTMAGFLKCRDVAQLASEGLDRRLTLKERFGVWTHLLVCKPCTRFIGQLRLLRRAGRQPAPHEDERLDADTRQRIRRRLERKDS